MERDLTDRFGSTAAVQYLNRRPAGNGHKRSFITFRGVSGEAPDDLSNRIANGKCIKQNDYQNDWYHHAVKHTHIDETQECTSGNSGNRTKVVEDPQRHTEG